MSYYPQYFLNNDEAVFQSDRTLRRLENARLEPPSDVEDDDEGNYYYDPADEYDRD